MQNTFNSQKMRTRTARNTAFAFILTTLIVSCAYSLVRLFTAPTDAAGGIKTKSDFLLMLTQCALGIVGMILPRIIEKYFNYRISSGVCIVYFLFIYCAIFLGEVLSFYYIVPLWDSMLHAASAAMLTLFALTVTEHLFKNNVTRVQTKPIFIYAFAISFAITLGVLWEIYEFSFDAILGLNMQKFRMADGELLLGRAALFDTMKDLIVDTAAAITVSLIAYIKDKRKVTRSFAE